VCVCVCVCVRAGSIMCIAGGGNAELKGGN